MEDNEADAPSTVVADSHSHVDSVKKATSERDEAAALEAAALDLLRLDRYERRALAQQKRAILEFMNIKLMKELARKAASQNSLGV